MCVPISLVKFIFYIHSDDTPHLHGQNIVTVEGPVNDGFHSKERPLNFSIAGPSLEWNIRM